MYVLKCIVDQWCMPETTKDSLFQWHRRISIWSHLVGSLGVQRHKRVFVGRRVDEDQVIHCLALWCQLQDINGETIDRSSQFITPFFPFVRPSAWCHIKQHITFLNKTNGAYLSKFIERIFRWRYKKCTSTLSKQTSLLRASSFSLSAISFFLVNQCSRHDSNEGRHSDKSGTK